MKCGECRRSIAAGIEAKRMICEYLQSDGTTKVFGLQMPDGPLTQATGQLTRGWHNRCYWALRKRNLRDSSIADLAAAMSIPEEEARRLVTGPQQHTFDPAEMQARAMLRRIVDRRQADPGFAQPQPSDWRDQTEANL